MCRANVFDANQNVLLCYDMHFVSQISTMSEYLQEKQRKSPNFQIFTQNKMYICSYQNLHLCFNTHVRQWLHLISQKCYLGQNENTSLIRVKSLDACIVT